MRVLNVIFDDRFGGMASRILQVAEVLRTEDFETILCIPQGEGNTVTFAEEKRVPVRRITFSPIPSFGKLGRLTKWLTLLPFDIRRFSRLYREERADLVHVNGAFFVPPAVAAKLSGVPLVWHMNDTIIPRRAAPLFGKLVNGLADWVMLSAQAVGEHYGIRQSRRTAVYAPVDVERYKPNAEDESDSTLRMGILANRTPVKGIEYFLRAAAQVRKRLDRDLEIVMAGARLETHPTYSRKLDELIQEQRLGPSIHDYGFVTSVVPVLSRLNVLVLTSLNEACPMVVLEAMASGVPVVATDVGGIREILSADAEHPAGLLVPARDVDRTAEAVVDLLTHPDRAREMGRNGRRIAAERFSVELCARRHKEVYETVVSR
jgi:glycosyltransferase involved in cell wall biosynthesis